MCVGAVCVVSSVLICMSDAFVVGSCPSVLASVPKCGLCLAIVCKLSDLAYLPSSLCWSLSHA